MKIVNIILKFLSPIVACLCFYEAGNNPAANSDLLVALGFIFTIIGGISILFTKYET